MPKYYDVKQNSHFKMQTIIIKHELLMILTNKTYAEELNKRRYTYIKFNSPPHGLEWNAERNTVKKMSRDSAELGARMPTNQ